MKSCSIFFVRLLRLAKFRRTSFLVILLFISCNKEPIAPAVFPLLPLQENLNNREADRINLILIGTGYLNMNEFLATARRDLALDGKEQIDLTSFDKVLFGLFAIEPFKSNLKKFNIWYYPEQITTDPLTFVQSQRNSSIRGEHDFQLPFATYMIFSNPNAEPQSFAYPSNVMPGEPLVKKNIVFGSTSLARYAASGSGMDVLAHELGHSLFNLRDEYVRTGPEFFDRFGFNIAPTLSEARSLWGDVERQVDPFYYTWANIRKTAGFWIDKTQPLLIGTDKITNKEIYTWNPTEDEIRVGFFEGGGITKTGVSWRPTVTSLMSNEDVRDKSWPQFPPVFGAANRKVMENVLQLFSGQ